MNRELTVNLRLTAATGENAKVASQLTDSVNQIQAAVTAASKAAEAIGKNISQMGSVTKTASESAGNLKSGIDSVSQSATTAASSVNKLATAVKQANEAQVSGVAAWTSMVKRYDQVDPDRRGRRQYDHGLGPMNPEFLNNYSDSDPVRPDRRDRMWQRMYDTPIGPAPFGQLTGQELREFIQRQQVAANKDWWRTPKPPGMATNDGMFEGGAGFIGPVRPGMQMGPFMSPEMYAARTEQTFNKGQSEIAARVAGDAQAAREAEEIERNLNRATTATQKFLSGVSQLAGGLTSLARSFVLLTAANDESALQMLQTIAQFEAVAQAVRGVISVVRGAAAAWGAYKTAAIAAAAAQGITLSGGAVALAAGAGIAGTAVASAGTGLAGLYVGNALQVAGSRLYGVNDQSGAVNQGFGTRQEYEDPFSAISSMFEARSSAQRSAEGASILENDLQYRNERNERRRMRRAMELSVSRSDWQIDSEQNKFISGLQDPARNITWRDGFDRRISENTSEAISVQNRLNSADLNLADPRNIENREDVLKERVALTERLNELGKERLSIAQQEAETAQKMMASLQGNLAQMGGGDIRQLANAIRAAQGGDDLTAKQIGLLRRNNIQGYDEQIQRSEQAIVSKNQDAKFIYEDQRQKTQVDQLTQNVNVALKSEMVLKVQAEIDAKAPEWLSTTTRFIKEQIDKLKAETNAMIEQQFQSGMSAADKQMKARQSGSTTGQLKGGGISGWM